jgi:CheY-like chemotaxis protein
MERKIILLVEDNPDDAELTTRAFEKANVGNKLIVAKDGVEALEYLFNPGNPLPEVVLLDLNLPKLGGIEVLRKIRASGRTGLLPVVILTSSKEERDMIDSYKLGANSYVQKPVDFVEFTEATRQLGLYWLLLNQRPASALY